MKQTEKYSVTGELTNTPLIKAIKKPAHVVIKRMGKIPVTSLHRPCRTDNWQHHPVLGGSNCDFIFSITPLHTNQNALKGQFCREKNNTFHGHILTPTTPQLWMIFTPNTTCRDSALGSIYKLNFSSLGTLVLTEFWLKLQKNFESPDPRTVKNAVTVDYRNHKIDGQQKLSDEKTAIFAALCFATAS